MRKMLMLVGLAALVAFSQVGSAGATGELPGGKVVCEKVFVPADVDVAVEVQKEILILGEVFDEDKEVNVVKVVKTIEVEVCVKVVAGAVVAKIDLEAALKGIGQCPHGGSGTNILAPVSLQAGLTGGKVEATVRIVVHDDDSLLGGIVKDETRIMINEKKTITVPPTMVKDTDTIKAKVCVGPVKRS